MTRVHDDPGAAQAQRAVLDTHVAECADCRTAPPPTARIAALLDAQAVGVDAAAMAQRTFTLLQPEIGRLATQAMWRKVVAALLLALLPLPVVLACDAYLLGVAYQVASTLLPATVAAYLIFGYAAFLVLLFATTYATIPLFLAGRRATQQPAFG